MFVVIHTTRAAYVLLQHASTVSIHICSTHRSSSLCHHCHNVYRHQSHQAICLGAILQRAHTLLTPPGAHPDPPCSIPGSHPVTSLWVHSHTHSPVSLCRVHSTGLPPHPCCGLPSPGPVQPAEVSHHYAPLVPDGVHQWLGRAGSHATLHAGQLSALALEQGLSWVSPSLYFLVFDALVTASVIDCWDWPHVIADITNKLLPACI